MNTVGNGDIEGIVNVVVVVGSEVNDRAVEIIFFICVLTRKIRFTLQMKFVRNKLLQ